MKSKRVREAAEPEGREVDPMEIEAPSKKRKRTSDEDAVDLKKAKKDKKEKKDKKDKKDKKHKKESRKERKEKRKDLQALPEQDDEIDDTPTPVVNGGVEDSPMANAASQPAAPSADAADSEKSAKRDKKKEKKEKKAKRELQDADAPTNGDAEDTLSPKKKQKKSKQKKASQDNSTTADPDTDADVNADAEPANSSAQKADRHIVFVGNLPFSATAETIKAHFVSLSPSSVRCMSDPKSDKPCRGIAFVEFAKVWHMRTCLDKFHHSMFNDGVSPPRRINVELTAGGGGKTKKRQDKIREKNLKLDENRTKRIEREKTAKEENKANGNSATQQHMEDSVHPSRRGFVPEY